VRLDGASLGYRDGVRDWRDDPYAALAGPGSALLVAADGHVGWGPDDAVAADAVQRFAGVRRLTGFGRDLPALVDHFVSCALEAARAMPPSQDWGPAMGFDAALALIADRRVTFAWAGGIRGVVVRAGRVVASTEPHTYGCELRRQGRDDALAANPTVADIRTRILGVDDRDAANHRLDIGASTALTPGDVVALCSADIWSRCDDTALAAAIVRAAASPAGLARALVEVGAGEPGERTVVAATL
jgi:serine/threonine protein phosphatase PrpC